jgi:hypothetical protein
MHRQRRRIRTAAQEPCRDADTLATLGSLGLLALHRERLAGALHGYREQWHDGGHF